MNMNKKTLALLLANTVLTLSFSHGSQYDFNLKTQSLMTYGPPPTPSDVSEVHDNIGNGQKRRSEFEREMEQVKRRRIEEENNNNTGFNRQYMPPEIAPNLLTTIGQTAFALRLQLNAIYDLRQIMPICNIDPNVIQNIQADLQYATYILMDLTMRSGNRAATISTPMQMNRTGNGSNTAQPRHPFQTHNNVQIHYNRAVLQNNSSPSTVSSMPAANIPQTSRIMHERHPQTQNNNVIILDDSPSPEAHGPINNAPPPSIPAPNLLQTNRAGGRLTNTQMHHNVQTHNNRAVSQKQTSSSPSHPPIITPRIAHSNHKLTSKNYQPYGAGNPNKVNNISDFYEGTYDSLQEYKKILQSYKVSNPNISLLDYQHLLNWVAHVSYDYGRMTISIGTFKDHVFICKDLTPNCSHTLFNSIENTECKELIFQIFRESHEQTQLKKKNSNQFNTPAISFLIESGIIFHQDHKTIDFLNNWLQQTKDNGYYTNKSDIYTLVKQFPLTYVNPLMRLKSTVWEHCFVPFNDPPSRNEIKKLTFLISLQEMSKILRNMSDSNVSSVPENSSEYMPNVTNSISLTNAPQGEIVNNGNRDSVSLTNAAQREIVNNGDSVPLTNTPQNETVNNGNSVPLTSAPQNDIFDNWYETTFTPFTPSTEYYLGQFDTLFPNSTF